MCPEGDLSAVTARRLATALLYLMCGALQALVLARVILKVLGAWPEEPLPRVIYALTDPLLSAFSRLHPLWQARDSVLEAGPVLLLLIILIVAMLGARLLRIQLPRRSALPEKPSPTLHP